MNTIRNNVQLVGNVSHEPEIKILTSGKKVARFSIACTESHLDSEGRNVETTNWFNCVAWEGLATITEKYIVKGKQVAISGKLVNASNYSENADKSIPCNEIICSDILLFPNK